MEKIKEIELKMLDPYFLVKFTRIDEGFVADVHCNIKIMPNEETSKLITALIATLRRSERNMLERLIGAKTSNKDWKEFSDAIEKTSLELKEEMSNRLSTKSKEIVKDHLKQIKNEFETRTSEVEKHDYIG